MVRIEAIFVCGSCGTEYGKWQGQCGACGEWNSLKEVSVSFQKGKNGVGKIGFEPVNSEQEDFDSVAEVVSLL